MKAFDEKATCPKCGSIEVYVVFCSGKQWWLDDTAWFCPDGEHLHRRCARCRYSWLEACIDAHEEALP
jgi:predicted RNA-binding Zn-ribbon protein involved in translation (DUF1610 family)